MTEVLVTGTFNVLHAGHCQLLEFASQFGKVTVGINADPYLREKYGENAVPLTSRAYCLRSNKFVDKVVVFAEEEPSQLIRKLRPRLYIKGPDYAKAELPEEVACNEVGARIVIHHTDKIHDSSQLVHSLNRQVFIPLDFLD